ncbi:MAG: EAL domain-containing protein, partial [Chloroflexi bacterium]
SIPLFARLAGVEQPTLGLAAMAKYLRRPVPTDGRPDAETLQFAGRSLPVDASTSLRINFFGAPSRPYQQVATFRVVSYVDVLRGRVDPSVWRDGLVLVGALGATGLADDYWTPVSEQALKMSGVEIHANVAATLLSSQFLHEVAPPTSAMLVAVLALLTCLLTVHLRLIAACAVVPLLLSAFAAASALALYAGGWLVPLASPLASSLVCFFFLLAVRVAAERRELARVDALTGLPNRIRLVEIIRGSPVKRDSSALLLLDVDRFKDVNDTLGHPAGDQLLRDLAARLRRSLPESSTVARLGGDEFGVWLPVASADCASSMCSQMIAALALPFVVCDREVTVSASAGIVLRPEDGDSAETLLRRAELAMYSAKHSHSVFARFTPELDRHSAERLAMIGALRQATQREELVLFCQPKIDCHSGTLAGVEALVRWQHPEHGLILPDRFIGLAEEAGLISLITRWVLNAALLHIRSWLDAGLEVPASVNLSAHDFDDPQLPGIVAELLEHWAVPARLLTVEVTETAVLEDPARAMDVLSRLGAHGVRASLDDFGTGYSSLSAIQRLPLQEIKIDRSFVRDMALAHRDRAIVRSTIELGHSLGLRVVAEGVEDEATFRLLAELGCDQAQGYVFARPLPAGELLSWVREYGGTGIPEGGVAGPLAA